VIESIMCSWLEKGALRNKPGGEIAPQRHHQLAGQGHDGDALEAFAGVGDTL
jgi:hypothetical protein